MVDKSWGTGATTDVRVRSNDSIEERAAARARAREERAGERLATMALRRDERATARAQDAQARERDRTNRREAQEAAAAADPHAAAARRPRGSGRKDIVREQRDTRGYATVVDIERMRVLAKRGASVTGLAGAFGISEAEVEQALAGE